MDGAEFLRGRLRSLTCAACGRPYRRQRIRVLAQREALYFIDLACSDCGSEAVAIVSIEGDERHGQCVELGDVSESPPVSAAEVLEMHRFLEGFDGDFRRHFEGSPGDSAGTTTA